MKTIYLKLASVKDQGTGAIVGVGIQELSTPNWESNCSGIIGHECMSMVEVRETLGILKNELDIIEKEAEKLFKHEKTRLKERRLNWQKPTN